MTHVTFDIKDNNYSMKAIGHAEYNPGNDIVCSAISTLAYTLACGISNSLTQTKNISLKSGNVSINVKSDTLEVRAMFKMVLLGYKMLAEKYSENILVVGGEELLRL